MTEAEKEELLERRLSEKVEAQVRSRLFRTYAIIGTVAATILTYGGWNIKTDIQTRAEAEINKSLESQRQALEHLQWETDGTSKRMGAVLSELEHKLRDPNVSRLDELFDTVQNITAKSRDIDATLQRTSAASANIEEISTQLSDLAKNVELLSAAVESSHKQQDVNNIVNSLKIVSNKAKSIQEKVADIERRPTVWFQFAAAPRQTAQNLSRTLKNQGFIVPGEERTETAANKREVRFFYEKDHDAADRLATSASNGIVELGLEPVVVKAVPYVDYKGMKPPQGVLELWLELPAATSRR